MTINVDEFSQEMVPKDRVVMESLMNKYVKWTCLSWRYKKVMKWLVRVNKPDQFKDLGKKKYSSWLTGSC